MFTRQSEALGIFEGYVNKIWARIIHNVMLTDHFILCETNGNMELIIFTNGKATKSNPNQALKLEVDLSHFLIFHHYNSLVGVIRIIASWYKSKTAMINKFFILEVINRCEEAWIR